MRNFKRFLALVLAVLMVSACAVSVSAKFADQALVDASEYAPAIELLNSLGVLQGRDDGNYDPAGTLTRTEAAVVMARLLAGSKKYDWASQTVCLFSDVTEQWSFGYINYAATKGAIDGVGDGKFNPDAKLKICEAVAMFVKALGLKAEVLELDKAATPVIWYINYVNAAEQIGLLNKIDVLSYEEPCSRAMLAQLAYNLLNLSSYIEKAAEIKSGFGLDDKDVFITAVDSTKVSATGLNEGEAGFDLNAFKTALKASGYDVEAADLVNCWAHVTYINNGAKNAIYSVRPLSSRTEFVYTDGQIKNVLKDNNATDKITIAGVEYVVGKLDSTVATDLIGGSNTSSNGIIAKINAKGTGAYATFAANTKLPTYFTAYAYDDNNDGDFERLFIDEYDFATVKTETAGTDPNKFTKYTVNFLDKTTYTNTKAVTLDGTVASAECPVLVNVKGDAEAATITVLDTAETVTGTFTAVKATSGATAGYVRVAGTKYTDTYKLGTIDAEKLNQTVTIYAFDDMFLGLASATVTNSSVIVDKAEITEDGTVLVTGYTSALAPVSIEINGVYTGSRMKDLTAYQNDVTAKVYKLEEKSYNFGNIVDKYWVYNTKVQRWSVGDNDWRDVDDSEVKGLYSTKKVAVGDVVATGTTVIPNGETRATQTVVSKVKSHKSVEKFNLLTATEKTVKDIVRYTDGTKDANGKYVEFEAAKGLFAEGAVLSLQEFASGTYATLAASNGVEIIEALASNGDANTHKLKVNSSYIYVDGVATYKYNNTKVYTVSDARTCLAEGTKYFASVDDAYAYETAVVLNGNKIEAKMFLDAEAKVVAATDVFQTNAAKDAYDYVTYTVADSFDEKNGVIFEYSTKDADDKVSYIQITNKGTDIVAPTQDKLAAESSILQILAKTEEEVYAGGYYKAFDIFSGKEVEVYAANAVTAGEFYEYDANAEELTVGAATKWIAATEVEVRKNGLEFVGYFAAPNKLVKNGENWVPTAGTKAQLGIDQITIYNVDANGIITKSNNSYVKALSTLESGNYKAYSVAGQLIIVSGKLVG